MALAGTWEGCWCHFLWQGTLGAKWLLSKVNDRKPVSLVLSLNQHMALTSSYSVILSHAQSLDLPTGDFWQCPNTFLIVTISEVSGWLYPWHLLGKDLGCSWGPYNAKGRHLKQRITWCKMSKGLMLKNGLSLFPSLTSVCHNILMSINQSPWESEHAQKWSPHQSSPSLVGLPPCGLSLHVNHSLPICISNGPRRLRLAFEAPMRTYWEKFLDVTVPLFPYLISQFQIWN